MPGFIQVEGGMAVVASKGKYMQVPVYTRNQYLFLKIGSGFVKVYANGSTTVEGLRLDELSTDIDLWADRFDQLRTEASADRKPVQLQAGVSTFKLLPVQGT